MDLFDKVVLITGASSGIGQACGPAFGQAGAKVALLARSAEPLQKLADDMQRVGHRVLVVPADVTDRAAVEKAVANVIETFGELDVLVNNAGQALVAPVAEISPEQYRQVLELNVLGWLNCLQAVVPVMRRQNSGVIISVSSMVSKIHIPNLAGYVSTKHALDALAHTARIELAPDNIRVVSVYPNVTRTNFFNNTIGAAENRAARAEMARERPMANPEVVARKIVEAAREEPRDQYMNARDRIFGTAYSVFQGFFDKRIASRQR